MVTINDNTIRQNSYETIYDVLYGNIGSYTSSSQPTVKASYTDDAKNLPEIVVYPIDVDEGDYAFGQTFGSKEVRSLIEVYTKKKKDLDILADEINVLIDTKITGLQLIGKSESTAFETPNNNKVHLKILTYTFMRK